MPWPDKDFGIKDNPITVSPYVAGNDESSLGPTSNNFRLLDGENFMLLNGEQFDLLG